MRLCSVKEAKLPGKKDTFALITPKRNLYLQASTYKDMLMWMNAMNEAKKVLSHSNISVLEYSSLITLIFSLFMAWKKQEMMSSTK